MISAALIALLLANAGLTSFSIRESRAGRKRLAAALGTSIKDINSGLDRLSRQINSVNNNLIDVAVQNMKEHKHAKEVLEAAQQELTSRAAEMKVHAQDLLDRSHTHAINPRQAVRR